MARHQKNGLMYFPLDTDIFTDRKIRMLQAKFGCEGTTFYLYLISNIYKEGYYIQADEDFIYIISSDLKIEYDKVLQIMEFFFERSLFDKKLFEDKKILTSLGIQRRYQLAVKAKGAKRNIKVEEEIWLLDESETLPFIVFSDECERNSSKKNNKNSKKNNTNKSKVNKSKIKESKETESKEVCEPESSFDETETETDTTTEYGLEYDETENYMQSRVKNRDCLKIPAKNGLFIVNEELFDSLCTEYPYTDVEACLGNIRKFLMNNPQKQRSKNNTRQYIELWISNDTQCGRNPRKPKTYEATYDIEEYESWSVVDEFESE